jgi:hypothetical protein
MRWLASRGEIESLPPGEPVTVLRSRWFDGEGWAPASIVAGPGVSGGAWNIQPSFTGGEAAVIVYLTSPGQIYASRSTDGGRTFPSYERLDAVAPRPEADSLWPRIASDQRGNAWVMWVDYGTGVYPSMLVRDSSDGGATWGPLRRLDSVVPTGAYDNFFSYGPTAAALPGVGVFTWGGWRNGPFYETLFQTARLLRRSPHAAGSTRDR